LPERLRGSRNTFQCLAYFLTTDIREAVFCKISPKELVREKGKHKINPAVEEELLEVT